MFLSNELKQEDEKGTFIKLYDSYLKQSIIFRDNYWFRKLDKPKKKEVICDKSIREREFEQEQYQLPAIDDAKFLTRSLVKK